MKRYRPNTKAVIVGIFCWVIKASFIPKGADFLFPLGLLLICIGGLTLTITAFVAMRKNDMAMNAYLRKQDQERKKLAKEKK